jgi:predicted phage gp36 major capsid-like protein
MDDPRDDLRATQESIRKDTDRLKDLEDQKASLDPGDERVAELSDQAERLSKELRDKTAAERDLAEST